MIRNLNPGEPEYRARFGDATEFRATDDDGTLGTLDVTFARFDQWNHIESFWEGEFLERVARGAFTKTMAESGSKVKVLFNHGRDPSIGMKSLGVPEVLEERDTGPFLSAPLFDTTYTRDLLPGLVGGAYGASYMFRVIADDWDEEPGESDHNPKGLPERTIREVRLFEAGPVTFPADADIPDPVGVRSLTDFMRGDPPPAVGAGEAQNPEPADGHSELTTATFAERAKVLRAIEL